MIDKRAIGARPTARHGKPHARAWGLARLAIVAAVLAVVLFETLGGGPPPGRLLAERFARAWTLREYPQMYAALDSRSRAALPLARFVAAERNIYATATATATATVSGAAAGAASGPQGGRVIVPVRVRTRIFGTLRTHFTLTLTGPAGSPKVRWNAPASFPGLAAGERLRRVDSAPTRGALLTRHGTPLSELSSASNVIGTVGSPTGSLLEQSIAAGFPATTPVGLDGLQQVFQRELGGTPGGSLYAGTRLLARAAPRPGADVRTSISPTLQTLAVQELGASIGGIVVMEPSTGELLAAAGAPLSELQPPGSTFKIITLTGVLEARLATAQTSYAYATSSTIGGFTLHNSNGESCGGTLANAFAVSCNSVFAPLGVRLGASRLVGAAEAYGFNAASPISIAAESTIPAAGLTSDFDVGESAIGQGQVLASPLQMARVAGTIALVGRRPVPTFALVARQHFPRVIPVSVARTIRALMRDVVRYGTGVAAQIPGVAVAGKTGTAQVATPAGCATGASGTTGTTGATSAAGTTGTTRTNATRDATRRNASGGASAPGGAPAPGGSSGASGAGNSGGAGAPTGSSGESGPAGPSGPSGSSGASAPTGPSGATGATSCPTFDNNPADTDAWFVAFAPEIHPRVVVAVLLPHDGAGGTTAAPIARVILEQALALTG